MCTALLVIRAYLSMGISIELLDHIVISRRYV